MSITPRAKKLSLRNTWWPTMSPELIALFGRLRETATFADVAFDDVNATNFDGDNALHWAASSNDIDAARLLIDAGIEINQRGDMGYTPLHEACAGGHSEMVTLLIEKGADLYAETEGDIPFTTARLHGKDDICTLLGPFMERAHRDDPQVYVRVRIRHLQREIQRLEQLLVWDYDVSIFVPHTTRGLPNRPLVLTSAAWRDGCTARSVTQYSIDRRVSTGESLTSSRSSSHSCE